MLPVSSNSIFNFQCLKLSEKWLLGQRVALIYLLGEFPLRKLWAQHSCKKCRNVLISEETNGLCAERSRLHPCGTGGGPDRECLLGALLPGAPHRSWWSVSGWCCPTELSWRPVYHFLSYWELRAPRSTSDIRGPGALGGWWAVLLNVQFKPPGFFLSSIDCEGVAANWDDGIQATSWRWRVYL